MSVLLVVFFFCIISLHLLIFLYKNVSLLCKIIGACNIFNITSNVLSFILQKFKHDKGLHSSFCECKVDMPSPEQAMT